MEKTCCAATGVPVVRITPLALALAVMLAVATPADAASIGHSRLVSAPGEPLHINVPIRELTDAEQQSLRVSAAPLAAWQQAGLTPPVQLSSLQVSVEQGFSADSRVVHVRSNQLFNGVVADLLLLITTAAGSQQHQVSLLADASRTVPPTIGGQPGASSASSPTTALGTPGSSGSISVRRGDTLFALAYANAVEGVSVYQMMVALQKANPQAFIHENINLVKAGATLSIPDLAALRAVSDREARRIFQQHAQAFAAYRQGVAGQRGEAVTGGSTQSGTVSNEPAQASVAPAAAGADQVVLSSGNADDAGDDQRNATQRNIAESETRVSQLERNVQSLNQALQMQGEAAKDAVLEGAAAVSQTLSEAATSMGMGSDESVAAGANSDQSGAQPSQGAAAGGQGAVADSAKAGSEKTVSSETGSEKGGSAVDRSDASSTDASSTGATRSAAERASQSQEGAGASGVAAEQAQPDVGANGVAAEQAQPDDGTGGTAAKQAGQGPNTALSSAQQGSGAAASAASDGQPNRSLADTTNAAQAKEGVINAPSGAAKTAAPASEQSDTSTSSKAEQPVSWLQQNLLGVITAILALIILVIAWVLRRASATRGNDGQGVVTEAMVQERLEKIDLDLSRSPVDERPPHSS